MQLWFAHVPCRAWMHKSVCGMFVAYLWRRRTCRHVFHKQHLYLQADPSKSDRWAWGSYQEPCSCAPSRTNGPYDKQRMCSWGEEFYHCFVVPHSNLNKQLVCFFVALPKFWGKLKARTVTNPKYRSGYRRKRTDCFSLGNKFTPLRSQSTVVKWWILCQ